MHLALFCEQMLLLNSDNERYRELSIAVTESLPCEAGPRGPSSSLASPWSSRHCGCSAAIYALCLIVHIHTRRSFRFCLFFRRLRRCCRWAVLFFRPTRRYKCRSLSAFPAWNRLLLELDGDRSERSRVLETPGSFSLLSYFSFYLRYIDVPRNLPV